MNLIPYIYTEAKNSADTGAPMMRAMNVGFPTDPNTATLDQQYMFGSQWLIAPTTTQGVTTQNVYVPAGEWYDFWNGGRFTGPGTKAYGAPVGTIPVYARPGAIIPLNLNADYQLGGAINNSVTNYTNLTFRVYPEGISSYDWYDDATSTTRTIGADGDWGNHAVTVNVSVMPTAPMAPSTTSSPALYLSNWQDMMGCH